MSEYRIPIEAGHIMMFARSIGETNPAYFETSRFGRILAPPTFVQAGAQYNPNYRLRPRPGQPWFGSGATSTKPPESGSVRGVAAGVGAEERGCMPNSTSTTTSRCWRATRCSSRRAAVRNGRKRGDGAELCALPSQ